MAGQTKDKGREWGFRSEEQLTGIKIPTPDLISDAWMFYDDPCKPVSPLDYVLIATAIPKHRKSHSNIQKVKIMSGETELGQHINKALSTIRKKIVFT